MFKGQCGHNVKKIKNHCIQCKKCGTCCNCILFALDEEQEIKFHTAKSKEKKVNTSDRYIAAELEVAGTKNGTDALKDFEAAKQYLVEVGQIAQEIRKWKGHIVYDGSLPFCGFEITTAPASGDKFIQQVNDITNTLKIVEPIITKECGVHIHVDARDFNFQDIAKLIKVYASMEVLLFAMVPKHRRNSKYCYPCGADYKKALDNNDDGYWKRKTQIVLNTYNNYDSDTARKSKYNDARYNALNLHSWFYRGTIEFRLIEGSVDPQHITDWGMLWAKILDYVRETDVKEIDRLVAKASKAGKRRHYYVMDHILKDDKALFAFTRYQIAKNNSNSKKKVKGR